MFRTISSLKVTALSDFNTLPSPSTMLMKSSPGDRLRAFSDSSAFCHCYEIYLFWLHKNENEGLRCGPVNSLSDF